VAVYQENSWPPARTFVAAYKENLMAADTCEARSLPLCSAERMEPVLQSTWGTCCSIGFAPSREKVDCETVQTAKIRRDSSLGCQPQPDRWR
jgi:hypothetical protein